MRKKRAPPIPNLELLYYSCMNRHGRAKLTQPTTSTKEVLVQCLSSLDRSSYAKQHPILETSLWFGLLRESPGLWSDTTTTTTVEYDNVAWCHRPKKRSANEPIVSTKTKVLK